MIFFYFVAKFLLPFLPPLLPSLPSLPSLGNMQLPQLPGLSLPFPITISQISAEEAQAQQSQVQQPAAVPMPVPMPIPIPNSAPPAQTPSIRTTTTPPLPPEPEAPSVIANCTAILRTENEDECNELGGIYVLLDTNTTYRMLVAPRPPPKIFLQNDTVTSEEPIDDGFQYGIEVNVPVSVCGNWVNMMGFMMNVYSNNENCEGAHKKPRSPIPGAYPHALPGAHPHVIPGAHPHAIHGALPHPIPGVPHHPLPGALPGHLPLNTHQLNPLVHHNNINTHQANYQYSSHQTKRRRVTTVRKEPELIERFIIEPMSGSICCLGKRFTLLIF